MKVFLSLGSNIGNRKENIFTALSIMQSSGFLNIEKISSFYETSAVGEKQRNFYNIALQASASLNPRDLLSFVKQVEKLAGRKKTKRRGPRIIDIDILLLGNRRINYGNLTVPHKEMLGRLFVLIPLSEISPDCRFPLSNRKINQILDDRKLTLKNQKVKIIRNINGG